MKNCFESWLRKIISAVVYTSIDDSNIDSCDTGKNAAVEFVIRQHSGMPDFLRTPLAALTLVLDVSALFVYGRRFHKLSRARRSALFGLWRSSPIGFFRDLTRFYDGLAVLAWTSRGHEEAVAANAGHDTPRARQPAPRFSYQVGVLGSGPGGAITAALLAEKGFDVVLLEEGGNRPLESCAPFSLGEMVQKYRNGGLTPAMGKPKVAYVEGRTAGGGSEINSGLYHRTPPDIMESWRSRFNLQATDAEMLPHFEACEKDVSVGLCPGTLPKASLKLQEGADILGWQAQEVPRWFAYDGRIDTAGISTGHRQSMTRTFLQRFTTAGGTLADSTRAHKIFKQGGRFRIETRGAQREGRPAFECETLFVSCGAIGTPALLQRSGIRGRFGQGLQMHPTVKVVAEFDEEVNSDAMGVPVHQVKEFAPHFSFGCSISSMPYLALALLDHPHELPQLQNKWKRMAIYYAMIVPSAEGSVRALPGYGDPLVSFQPNAADLSQLSTGLRRLCELLFAAGAVRLLPSITGFGPLEKSGDLSRLPAGLPGATTNLMTIHLFSSCRMGENRDLCSVDSFGRVTGVEGLHIADASLLPSAPGVNPQGSLMAFARRNALAFAGRKNLN
jgi:choline dehydrogenase-like flavoprotein